MTLFVLLETALPAQTTQVAAVYDGLDQAQRRAHQISERRCREFNEAQPETQPNISITFQLRTDIPPTEEQVLLIHIEKVTTVVTPGGFFLAESKQTTTELCCRFTLMAGCERVRINNMETQLADAENKAVKANQRVGDIERQFAARLDDCFAQIETLQFRLEAAEKYKQDYQKVRKLADQYLLDLGKAKFAAEADARQIVELEGRVKISRSLSSIYTKEIERLKKELTGVAGHKDKADFLMSKLTNAHGTISETQVENQLLQAKIRVLERKLEHAQCQYEDERERREGAEQRWEREHPVQRRVSPAKANRTIDLQYAAILAEMQTVMANRAKMN